MEVRGKRREGERRWGNGTGEVKRNRGKGSVLISLYDFKLLSSVRSF